MMNNSIEQEKTNRETNTWPAYVLDPEIAAVMAVFAEQGPPPVVKRGDWKTLRENGNAMWEIWAGAAPSYPDVQTKKFFAKTKDGVTIELRWYAKEGYVPGSAIVYAHGGGMILGGLDVYDFVISEYVSATGVPFLSVDYRLAPEAKGNSLAEDVFLGITWLTEHAAEFGVNADRIAIMGDSGGGGPVAGAAIIARERNLSLVRQILIYPMLDDRNLIPDPNIEPFAAWTYDNNFTAWNALLGDQLGTEQVSPVAAPARLKNFTGLAPAYIEVGELDIFRDEDIAYAQQLIKAGVPTELHVHPGALHGFDRIAPNSKLTERAMNDRLRVIRSI